MSPIASEGFPLEPYAGSGLFPGNDRNAVARHGAVAPVNQECRIVAGSSQLSPLVDPLEEIGVQRGGRLDLDRDQPAAPVDEQALQIVNSILNLYKVAALRGRVSRFK